LGVTCGQSFQNLPVLKHAADNFSMSGIKKTAQIAARPKWASR
jgi:hypothetical protein